VNGVVDRNAGETMKLGDTLYRFDGNRRVYREGGAFGGGGPIYREHFEPLKIVGENRMSWILERGWKVRKSDLKGEAESFQYGGRGFFTAEGMELDIWLHDHKHRIVAYIERQATPTQLKQIAELIGYKER
jgi:hypothetical protein